MATAPGLLNQSAATGQPLAGARFSPMASSNSDTNSTTTKSSASGITANDFLTLLVTEMKNQDPTANNDPNQYINQLVNVNSLQQLISINETLTSAYGSPDASANVQRVAQAKTNDSAESAVRAKPEATDQAGSVIGSSSNSSNADNSNLQNLFNRLAHGNLSTPEASPAAERLAHALDGRKGASVSK